MTESIIPEPIQEPVSVDDNGAALTVDGTVAVTNAGLTALNGAISGTEVQADILTIAAGDNNIGNVDIVTMPDATVIGKAADGAAVSGNPVLIAGQDGTNVQSLKTDTSGELQVDVLTMPSTTVTATNLDVRDLTQASDSVAIGDGTTVVEVVATQADNLANTTNGLGVTAMGYVYDGATWDRAKGDSTDGALVNLGANNDVTVTGTVTEASGSAIKTAVELIDDTVATDGAAVPTKGILIAGNDTTNAQTIHVDTSGDLQVDVLTIAAGDNNIGNVDIASIAAGDNNIGNVDIVTVPAPLSTTGGGTEATALRVTVANDSTGVLSVDDNGSALTVDNGGTFATQDSQVVADNAGFTDGTTKVFTAGYIYDEVAGTGLTENDAAAARIDVKRAVVGVIEDETTRGRRATVTAGNALKVDPSAVTQPVSNAGITTIAGAVSGTEMQVDVVTMPTVTIGDGTDAVDVLADGADNVANTVNQLVTASMLYAYDGTAFDRVTNGGGAEATALRVTVANDSTGVLSVDDNGSALTVDWNGTAPPIGAGVEATALRVTVATDSTGVLSVDDNGSSLTVDNGGTFAVQPGPSTTGGLLIHRSIDLDETEEEVKATAGQVYGWFIANLATSTRFVKFYNDTAANVIVGTTAPAMTLPIPGNSSDDVAANALGGHGITFGTAICVAATTGVADNDTGAPGANEVVINVLYK